MDIIKSTGPGQRLRTAREAIKLSIDQVAHHLRLERKVIVDMEADYYDEMPRFTFIRGYLRSYARLVDLPADELVLAFDSLALEEKPIKSIGDSFVVKERPNLAHYWKNQWIPYLLMAAIILLGGLVFQTWTQQNLYDSLKNLVVFKKAENSAPISDTAVVEPENQQNDISSIEESVTSS